MSSNAAPAPPRTNPQFTEEEIWVLFEVWNDYLPYSGREEEIAAEAYNERVPYQRSVQALKKKFNSYLRPNGINGIPTGDPLCPPEVREAKRINKKIVDRAGCATGSTDEDFSEDEGEDEQPAASAAARLFESSDSSDEEKDEEEERASVEELALEDFGEDGGGKMPARDVTESEHIGGEGISAVARVSVGGEGISAVARGSGAGPARRDNAIMATTPKKARVVGSVARKRPKKTTGKRLPAKKASSSKSKSSLSPAAVAVKNARARANAAKSGSRARPGSTGISKRVIGKRPFAVARKGQKRSDSGQDDEPSIKDILLMNKMSKDDREEERREREKRQEESDRRADQFQQMMMCMMMGMVRPPPMAPPAMAPMGLPAFGLGGNAAGLPPIIPRFGMHVGGDVGVGLAAHQPARPAQLAQQAENNGGNEAELEGEEE